MRKSFLTFMLLAATAASAQENPLWMRYPSISPDGSKIAFAYKGDIFCVDVNGGEARQLTTNPAYDYKPVWSPDGSKIAFASNREGGFDVYVMDARGGEPRRLTTNSAGEIPVTWRDNNHIVFQSSVMPTAESIIFAGNFVEEYVVDLDGHRPTLFSTLQMDDISINTRGEVLYHDNKGYEDKWRKHHTSPIARDIWLEKDGTFKKLTSFAGEDRNPVWAADGESYYYLSEQDGTFNIYINKVAGGSPQQLTRFSGNPVRFLSSSKDGKLCFGYDGEIYTLVKGGQPSKVKVNIVADRNDRDLVRQINSYGATEISVSPSGKEVAFVMHGDVYVTSVEYRTTKRLTDTPEQERDICFAPDGRSVVYASERGGVWQIYVTSIKDKDEKSFTYATQLTEERLTNSMATSQMPKYSPDGKMVAFFENRGDLRVIDVKSKDILTVLDGKNNYSYSDGDLWFEWSPDSRWLLSSYMGGGGWNSNDIALVDASGKKAPVNLSNSGYTDTGGRWVLDGKAILFASDRAGYRSHGSWGAEYDAYLMFLDLDAYDHFCMTKEEAEIADKNDKDKKKEEEKKEKDEKKKKDDEEVKVEKVKPLEFDIENCRDRIVRLTNNSSRLSDAVLSKDGKKLYYITRFEAGNDLWEKDLREGKTKILVKGVGYGGMQMDKDGKNVFLCGNGIKKIDLGNGSSKNIDFEAWFNMKPYEERQYLFDHIWRQVKDKFYDVNLHGVDWEAKRKTYERFLPYINNNFDFAEMLSEMLGELNASHTGCRYYASGSAMRTASLGLFLDEKWEGDGLKIKEVIKRGPFAVKKTGVKAGDIIESIDGVKIMAGDDYNALLDGKAGKPVRIGVKGKKEDIIIKPISSGELEELLYKRWVDRNRAFVDSISGGRIAYVHVKAMDSESFRKVYEELLSESNRNRDAVVVDERHNGGGWLHDDLCTLLSGKEYQQFVPRDKYIGRDPYNKWTKPSCVLICEDDYSNGHGFPWVYKELGIGKLIGTPVAGTMTAVWWERLMDSSLVFGIPQVGCRDMRGVYGENTTLNPDIEVYNTPEDYINGYDRQLERAVREMMKKRCILDK
ncbi:MAG: S41 family peptidase [Prevotellaceae bacterium]|nr:S41 family peptidase [Prevotellaceae bacterium]